MQEKKYTKVLWKIEELWNRFYKPLETTEVDTGINYPNNISKYYKKFKYVNDLDFVRSDKIRFSDGYGNYFGLKDYQITYKHGKNIYLFDNHNEILYPLVEMSSLTKHQYAIVHIDAHPDDALFKDDKITKLTLETVEQHILVTRISDFFDSISETNLTTDIHRITHSDSFEFFVPPPEPFILSLDIDIFGPEGDFTTLEEKVRVIALAWAHADAVCIATSPGFIDQDFAEGIIKIFTQESLR